jgi:hypothetical protein
MANKRLTAVEIQRMKTMVANGTAPEDIAKTFGMAISSVHNYKKRFKDQGLKFPSVRGKRPTGSIEPVSNVSKHVQSASSSIAQQDGFKFVVNGVSVQISDQAKNVTIGKDKIEINF